MSTGVFVLYRFYQPFFVPSASGPHQWRDQSGVPHARFRPVLARESCGEATQALIFFSEMPVEFQVGDIIGDYQITGVLGGGGMGKVFRVLNRLSDRA